MDGERENEMGKRNDGILGHKMAIIDKNDRECISRLTNEKLMEWAACIEIEMDCGDEMATTLPFSLFSLPQFSFYIISLQLFSLAIWIFCTL